MELLPLERAIIHEGQYSLLALMLEGATWQGLGAETRPWQPASKKAKVLILQPQGTDFCQQPRAPKRIPNFRKEHDPDDTLTRVLCNPEQRMARLYLDS